MPTAILRIHDRELTRLSWLTAAGETGHGDLEQAAQALASSPRLTLLVPGQDLLLAEAVVPAGSRQQRLQAAVYALEEQLAAPVEEQQVALGPIQGERIPAAVIDRDLFASWLAQLAAHSLQPARVVPDLLALPWQPGEETVLLEGETALVRTGPYQGFALETANLELLPGGEEKAARRLFQSQVPAPEEPGPLPKETQPIAQPLELFSRGLAATPAIDLLQGAFSREPPWQRWWRYWRAPATAAVVALCLLLAGELFDYLSLRREADLLTHQVASIYRQAFPEARHLINPRVQMETRLRELRRQPAGSPLLALVNDCGQALRESTGLTLRQLEYNAQALILEVQGRNLQAVEGFKDRLANRLAKPVRLEQVRKDEGRVLARVVARHG